MDTKKKTFHCKTTTEQELTGKKILQNCRNQLYLDFPYLDGAFTSLEYKADSSIDTIGTDGELIYFNPVFLMKKYLEDPAAVRRGAVTPAAGRFRPGPAPPDAGGSPAPAGPVLLPDGHWPRRKRRRTAGPPGTHSRASPERR